MRTTISYELQHLTKDTGAHVLYACESGSRAWGFASPDSDFDVRFLYVFPEETYASIDLPIETLDPQPYLHEGTGAVLDFGGWDLRKALRLFLKSNGPLLEWLHSPVVYQEKDPSISLLRALVPDILDPRALATHYLGMAKNSLRKLATCGESDVPAKTYLYAVRPLLAASWVIEHRTPAPVALPDLREGLRLPPEVNTALEELLARKATLPESGMITRLLPLDTYLETTLTKLTRQCSHFPTYQPDKKLVNEFFREVLSKAA